MNVVWCLLIFDTLTIQSILTGIGSPNETSQLNPIEMSMILGGAEIHSECGSKIIQRLQISVHPIPTYLCYRQKCLLNYTTLADLRAPHPFVILRNVCYSHECIRQ